MLHSCQTRKIAMAITIRNKKTEELIRLIGRRTGEGPSAVIRRLAQNEASGGSHQNEAEIRQRIAAMEELSRKFPPPEPKPSRDEIERERDALFDYLDEDPAESGKSAAKQ
jgi:hypothetical protein